MKKLSASVVLAQQLVGFDTRNPGSNELECITFLSELLNREGFDLTVLSFDENRPSLVASFGEGKGPALCFAGHIDTVPLGKKEWAFDPFGRDIKMGRLYGRGSSDMKSGIAAMVTAACNLKKRLPKDNKLILIIVAGEESGCQGSYHLAQNAGVLGRADALVITEPTNNYPLVGHKGALWLDIAFKGKTAHGAMPHKGVNAVYKAAEAVRQLEEFTFNIEPHPYLGYPTLNVGYLHGGINVNSVPDGASVGVDIRTIPGMSNEDCIEKIGSLLGGSAEITAKVNVSPLWTDPELPWVKNVYATVAPVIGEEPRPRTVAFFTDGPPLKAAYGGIPTLILGPGDPSLAHQTDEYCLIKEIEDATLIYEQLAEKWYNSLSENC